MQCGGGTPASAAGGLGGVHAALSTGDATPTVLVRATRTQGLSLTAPQGQGAAVSVDVSASDSVTVRLAQSTTEVLRRYSTRLVVPRELLRFTDPPVEPRDAVGRPSAAATSKGQPAPSIKSATASIEGGAADSSVTASVAALLPFRALWCSLCARFCCVTHAAVEVAEPAVTEQLWAETEVPHAMAHDLAADAFPHALVRHQHRATSAAIDASVTAVGGVKRAKGRPSRKSLALKRPRLQAEFAQGASRPLHHPMAQSVQGGEAGRDASALQPPQDPSAEDVDDEAAGDGSSAGAGSGEGSDCGSADEDEENGVSAKTLTRSGSGGASSGGQDGGPEIRAFDSIALSLRKALGLPISAAATSALQTAAGSPISTPPPASSSSPACGPACYRQPAAISAAPPPLLPPSETALLPRLLIVSQGDLCVAAALLNRSCRSVMNAATAAGYCSASAVDASTAPVSASVIQLKPSFHAARRQALRIQSQLRKPFLVRQARRLTLLVKKREAMGDTGDKSTQPCRHVGPCSLENPDCSCGSSSLAMCTALCGCGAACDMAWQGCLCPSGCRTRACPCFTAGRECDPSRCIGCGAADAAYLWNAPGADKGRCCLTPVGVPLSSIAACCDASRPGPPTASPSSQQQQASAPVPTTVAPSGSTPFKIAASTSSQVAALVQGCATDAPTLAACLAGVAVSRRTEHLCRPEFSTALRCEYLSSLTDAVEARRARLAFSELRGYCRNVPLLSHQRRHTYVGTSRIPGAGLGLFLAEDAAAGDLVGEYTGEVITSSEADRR
jgi:hypothetical protein